MGWWNFLGLNRLEALPVPHFVGEHPQTMSENHLIPASKPVKCYQAIFITVDYTQPLAMLIWEGLVEFYRIEST